MKRETPTAGLHPINIDPLETKNDGNQRKECNKDTDPVVTPDRRRHEQGKQRPKPPNRRQQNSKNVQDAEIGEQRVVIRSPQEELPEQDEKSDAPDKPKCGGVAFRNVGILVVKVLELVKTTEAMSANG